MNRIAIFVDATWLYESCRRYAVPSGRQLRMDYSAMPGVLQRQACALLSLSAATVQGAYIFGSYADNYDPLDAELVRTRLAFFEMLRARFKFHVETYPVDFLGNRLRAGQRTDSAFVPHEKCVDVALATALITLSSSYDVAIAIVGDQDYVPALRAIKRMGKQVIIASIRGACSSDYTDQRRGAEIRDAGPVWLEDTPELIYEKKSVPPAAIGRPVLSSSAASVSGRLRGSVHHLLCDKGLLRAENRLYRFYPNDLAGRSWSDIVLGMACEFTAWERVGRLPRAKNLCFGGAHA